MHFLFRLINPIHGGHLKFRIDNFSVAINNFDKKLTEIDNSPPQFTCGTKWFLTPRTQFREIPNQI